MPFEQADTPTAYTSETLALRNFLRRGAPLLAELESGGVRLEARAAESGAWFLILRQGQGGLALRAAPARGPIECTVESASDTSISLQTTMSAAIPSSASRRLRGPTAISTDPSRTPIQRQGPRRATPAKAKTMPRGDSLRGKKTFE